MKLFVFSAAIWVATAAAREEKKKRPNVLLLMADEHSGKVLGSVGNKIVKTPRLDSLAKSGVLFESAYCQSPFCVPSRASMVTGQMPSKVGVFGNHDDRNDVLRDTPVTLARTFTSAGYMAEWLGKEHWGTDNAGVGFGNANEAVTKKVSRKCRTYLQLKREVKYSPKDAQTFGNETKPERDTVVAEEAIRWLDEYDGTKPFFLGVSLRKPHYPFLVDETYYDMYKNVINVPRVTEQMIKNLPLVKKRQRVRNGWDKLSKRQTKKARAVYYGMVSFIDFQMGRIIDKLKEMGLDKETIIIYLSDHGELAGEHGVWYKTSFYEDAARVPLIMSYKKEIPAKTRITSPVQIMDVFPTLCDLCDIPIPGQVDGKTLMPLVRGEEDGFGRHALSETYTGPHAGRMVRKGSWKYIWYQNETEHLFNLMVDQAEEKNRCNNAKHAARVKKLNGIATRDFLEEPKRKNPTKKV